MRDLLSTNSYITPARKFYLRTFALVLFLATLGIVVAAGKPCDEQSKSFMPCVWWVFDGLEPVLWTVTLALGAYVVLITILFAVLGRYRDE
jgi:hypothetical protein